METPKDMDKLLGEILNSSNVIPRTLSSADRAVLRGMVERTDAGAPGFYACQNPDGSMDWFLTFMSAAEGIGFLGKCIQALAKKL